MKKYNKPAIKVIKIMTSQMLAQSSLGFDHTAVDASKAQGRDGFYFEEDEE